MADDSSPSKSLTVSVERFGTDKDFGEEHVAIEEPLELRVDGAPVSVVMRTPGHDEELMLGFLCTEGIVKNLAEITKISADHGDNRIVAFLRDDLRLEVEKLSRHVFSGSSCGLCGKATIDSIFIDHRPLENLTEKLSEKALLAATSKMEAEQKTFQATGGLHAAALFDLAGEMLVLREDVGRHNAVDKVIGRGLLERYEFGELFLMVSGRVSFEILQKALVAGIPCIAAVSAPSSLAVDFAKRGNQTLVGFLRPPRWNLYHAGALEIS